jgi:hypothetical protein
MRVIFTIVTLSLTFAAACSKKQDSAGGGSGATAGSSATAGAGAASGVVAPAGSGAVGTGGAGSDNTAAMGSGAATGSGAVGTAPTIGSGVGSGSDTEAAATGAGSEVVAPESMAHRAGMCPSTVFGATTSSAMKGQAVVVTIASTDKDAIAAIQKRTDALLAEKKAAPTGVGHDMRGTHGGGRGLCPIYVPAGAKATAKHEANGVVVTITSKGNPDDLAKEIDDRIAKATTWVKTYVKAGDQKTQGGVGGGSGEDGSNHSGRGDGKGHERKKGGGGGKGTGGGGGTGDGGGNGKAG